jgi:hypothetical protein
MDYPKANFTISESARRGLERVRAAFSANSVVSFYGQLECDSAWSAIAQRIRNLLVGDDKKFL